MSLILLIILHLYHFSLSVGGQLRVALWSSISHTNWSISSECHLFCLWTILQVVEWCRARHVHHRCCLTFSSLMPSELLIHNYWLTLHISLSFLLLSFLLLFSLKGSFVIYQRLYKWSWIGIFCIFILTQTLRIETDTSHMFPSEFSRNMDMLRHNVMCSRNRCLSASFELCGFVKLFWNVLFVRFILSHIRILQLITVCFTTLRIHCELRTHILLMQALSWWKIILWSG